MTCASCARCIEKRLNKVEGVSASVNYATERASVDFDPSRIDVHGLAAVVGETGYQAVVPEPEGAAGEEEGDEADPTAPLRRHLIVSAALSLPVLAISMVPALQFDFWQWLVLQLATPVVVWGRGPSTRRPGPTCATGRPPWTPSSPSAPSPPGPGRSWPCSSSRRRARHTHGLAPHPGAGSRHG